MGSGSMMRPRRGGRRGRGERTISIERGAAPRRRRPRCVCSCGAMEAGPTGPYRAPETAKNHRLARKTAARQYLISPLVPSLSLSSSSFLLFHWSLYFFLYSIPSTNSRGNPFSYSSYFTITISGSSRFPRPRHAFSLSLSFYSVPY